MLESRWLQVVLLVVQATYSAPTSDLSGSLLRPSRDNCNASAAYAACDDVMGMNLRDDILPKTLIANLTPEDTQSLCKNISLCKEARKSSGCSLAQFAYWYCDSSQHTSFVPNDLWCGSNLEKSVRSSTSLCNALADYSSFYDCYSDRKNILEHCGAKHNCSSVASSGGSACRCVKQMLACLWAEAHVSCSDTVKDHFVTYSCRYADAWFEPCACGGTDTGNRTAESSDSSFAPSVRIRPNDSAAAVMTFLLLLICSQVYCYLGS